MPHIVELGVRVVVRVVAHLAKGFFFCMLRNETLILTITVP